MKNIPLFICVFDSGSLELGLNHLQSLTNVGIQNYMAYVADKSCYNAVNRRGFNVTWISDADYSTTKKDFGTHDFIEFSFLRYKIIHEILVKEDRPVWYMDVDSVVLEDLMPYYQEYSQRYNGYDILFQNDIHMICSGCMLFFPNDTTKSLTQYIYNNMNDRIPDQHFVANLLETGAGMIKYAMFDFVNFPNGLLYFDNEDKIEIPVHLMEYKHKYRANLGKTVAFVHANWLIGNEVKKIALVSRNLWFV